MSDRQERHRSRDRSSKKRSRHRNRTPDNELRQQMTLLLERINALENQPRQLTRPDASTPAPTTSRAPSVSRFSETIRGAEAPPASEVTAVPTTVDLELSVADRIATAIQSTICNSVRSNQHFYISNFDPSLHDIEVWCNEVDQAKVINGWSDNECLSRIGNCLKGNARLWLNEWSTTDRSWSNFKREFKPLCPKNLDVADILFSVMSTNSDNYSTYADYARRSLLRLRIVKGLSEDLIAAIIIRGIMDPQIRAAATNAKLMPCDLVDFFSIYVKPSVKEPRVKTGSADAKPKRFDNTRKRRFEEGKCFNCGLAGHRQDRCHKRTRIERNEQLPSNSNSGQSNTSTLPLHKSDPCSFCKKPGHRVESCFAKLKSEARNKNNVNFCRENIIKGNNDVVVAVIQGVPTDILIDSGSTISLISTSLLKHFDCVRRPAFRVLRGIGGQEIESTYYVTLPIEFDEITMEVDLFVVAAEYMNTPVIIGTDVLNRKGVTYVRTSERQYIRHEDRSPAKVFVIEADAQVPVKTTLLDDDFERLKVLINEFSDYFITGTANTTVNTGSMCIRLNSDTPVKYRPYRLSHSETLRVREIVKDLLDKCVIRESESEYASPILLVKKKDGADRMCVDFRKLNELTVKDRFPLPLIDSHIDRLGQNTYFTSLDMATGFHQIPMDDESIHKTAFVTPEGHYEYLKMPYGLANAPVVYQRIISKTLQELIEPGWTLVYIDDVLILSDSIEEGFVRLRKALEVLTKAGFSINLKKCTFLSTEIEYLGRTISRGQVRPSASKVKALVESPTPKTVKQVRQFLGLASYFRRYIAGFASKVACIAKLTKKGVDFHWGNDQETARQEVIACLTQEPVLAIYDPKLPIEVHTDASSVGYGAVLLQIDESGHKRVIAYFSRLTQGAEAKYHSYELETLAVVKALQNFRHYLIGNKFLVVTDCNALKLTQRKKDLLPRIARWWIYLQDFDFSLEYRKGTCMSHADYLSRNPVNVCSVQKPQNWAQAAQAADAETLDLLEKLTDGRLDANRYVKKNDLLYYKYSCAGEQPRLLCFIPKGHRLSLLRIFHDEHDHPGIDKTVELILKHFWFPSLRAFVQKYVGHCLICLSHKKVPRAPLQPIHSWQKPEIPFETIHADALGPLPESNGYRYVLIVVDAYSKYCLLYPMYKQDAVELKRHITNTVSLFGTPKLIVADRGRMFQSAEFLNWTTDLGCDTHLITPEMHQSNGQVERYCRTLLNMIRIEVNHRQEKWSDVMWRLQLILNITKHRTTQQSPLNLLVGIDAATPVIRNLVWDVAFEGSHANREALREMSRQRASERLRQNQAQQDAYVNSGRRTPRAFEVGSMAFVIKKAQTTGKLDSCMRGPYKVVKVLPNGRYELQLVSGSYGKSTQAAAEFMVPWKGEWTPEICAAYFEGK